MISENQLDGWVRSNSRDAQGVIVELIYRLVAASCPRPKSRRFPLSDSIGQPGPDGELDTEIGFNPFVPKGVSYWEIGTGVNAGRKATDDFGDLTEATPKEIRRDSTFVFVTPLSGMRGWEYTWKKSKQASWIEKRRKLNEWKDIRVIDGTNLIDWLRQYPSVEQWLSEKMGQPAQIETLEQRWAIIREIGSPPPLIPNVFLANREVACAKVKEVFSDKIYRLRLDTYYPDQVVDFIAACASTLNKDENLDIVGRCIIISCADAWDAITVLRDPHILVADFDLDNDTGTKLLEKARRGRHSVIFRGLPGGIPDPSRVPLRNPMSPQTGVYKILP